MKIIKAIAAVFAIGIAATFIWGSSHPKPLDAAIMPANGLGQVVAGEVIRQLSSQGGRVVVLCVPTASAQIQAALESLQQAMDGHKNIQLTVKAFSADEVGLMDNISFEKFKATLAETTSANVIVSFLRVNSFTAANIARLPQPLPKIIAVRWDPEDVRQGMRSELVNAAVMAQVWTSLPAGHPKTSREWFDRYYELVTPQTTSTAQ